MKSGQSASSNILLQWRWCSSYLFESTAMCCVRIVCIVVLVKFLYLHVAICVVNLLYYWYTIRHYVILYCLHYVNHIVIAND